MQNAPAIHSTPSELAEQLRAGMETLRLSGSEEAIQRLLQFVALLEKWNSAYNLTAVRAADQMIARHLLDSLAIAPHLYGRRVLDIGTGGGLPGIPLAIIEPQRSFTLLDSNAKKTRFVIEAAAQLKLSNVEVVQERVEKFHPPQGFDTLMSRAFSSLADMVQGAASLRAPGGIFLAMKGVYPEEEIAALPSQFSVKAVETLQVPGLDAARHLVIIGEA